MKTLFTIILLTILTTSASAQTPEALNFKLTTDKAMTWSKVYESNLSIDEVFNYFNSQPITADLEKTDNKIMGRSGKTNLSKMKGTVMMARQDFDFFITIEVREGKYRVEVRNLKFEPIEIGVRSGGFGIASDVNGTWEDISVKNKHHEIRTNGANIAFLLILSNDLTKLFTIKDVKPEIW